MRAIALIGLALWGDGDGAATRPQARIPPLLDRAARDPAFLLRGLEDALVALGATAGEELAQRLEADAATATGAALARALARVRRDAAIPALVALAKSPEPEARAAAAQGLAVVPARPALDALLSLLGDERTVVVRAASEGIARIDRAAPKLAAVNEVAKVLDHDRVPMRRVHAAGCLVLLGGPVASKALESAIRDRDADVRGAAAESLGRLGSASRRARTDLTNLTEDRDREVRKQALLALGRLKEKPACPKLIELLSDQDPAIRANALWALRAISGYSFPPSPDRWNAWWEREDPEKTTPETTEDAGSG